MIIATDSKHHWNYFLSLEDDLAKVARYIEFTEHNLPTYSIELARILLSASSEVDVLLKQLCFFIEKRTKASNINHYQKIIGEYISDFSNESVFIHRYGFDFVPWKAWNEGENPTWWKSHNQVKHHRHEFFQEATLENAIKAMGGLYVAVGYFYLYKFKEEYRKKTMSIDMNKTCELLKPSPTLFQFRNEYHRHPSYLY
tara:strand:+ start:134245 stop:134841 length:597 start_codon:yes stop_codon:yes gene_type:complete